MFQDFILYLQLRNQLKVPTQCSFVWSEEHSLTLLIKLGLNPALLWRVAVSHPCRHWYRASAAASVGSADWRFSDYLTSECTPEGRSSWFMVVGSSCAGSELQHEPGAPSHLEGIAWLFLRPDGWVSHRSRARSPASDGGVGGKSVLVTPPWVSTSGREVWPGGSWEDEGIGSANPQKSPTDWKQSPGASSPCVSAGCSSPSSSCWCSGGLAGTSSAGVSLVTGLSEFCSDSVSLWGEGAGWTGWWHMGHVSCT